MDAHDFVCYDVSCESVVGVKEFQVAEALLEGRQEQLSQEVPSQWGPVHLFDLCLTFGHVYTAVAMAQRGIEGCRLEAYHLKRVWSDPPFSYEKSAFEYDDSEDGDDSDDDPESESGDDRVYPACFTCKMGWVACYRCCFGFPPNQGVWMKDWDVHLEDASMAAEQTAEQPLVRFTLEALHKGASLPFAVSEQAMAHLLDLAILTGNKEAAKRCVEQSKLRPLRRWSWDGLFDSPLGKRGGACNLSGNYSLWIASMRLEVRDQALLLAALSAGVKLQGLRGRFDYNYHYPELTFREAVSFSTSPWADFAELLPHEENKWVRNKATVRVVGNFFVDSEPGICLASLCTERMKKAQLAGHSLQNFKVEATSPYILTLPGCFELTLLDAAILLGQSDSAALCAAAGVELSFTGCFLLQNYVTPARSVLCAAIHEALALSWRFEISQKGIALYQLIASDRTLMEASVVHQICLFSMEMPRIVQELQMWDEANAWCQLRTGSRSRCPPNFKSDPKGGFLGYLIWNLVWSTFCIVRFRFALLESRVDE